MPSTHLQPPTSPTATDETCDVFHGSTEQMSAFRQALIPAESAGALAETFRALGDPTRVRILDALSRAELCVCDIATLLSLGESAVSHQLRLLRSLRLVRSRRAGRMVFYALDDAHILRLFAQGLEHVEEAMPVSRRASTGAEG
jgi:ArsR family transcriptional regulator, lead/cadmium/zinc/bismuth-responsive transcriptional repressor